MPATTMEVHLPFPPLGPLDPPATIEAYEALRLRAIYRPHTVYERKRILRNAAKTFGQALLAGDPHEMAEALYRHLSPERRAKYVTDAASWIEDFQDWHRRRN